MNPDTIVELINKLAAVFDVENKGRSLYVYRSSEGEDDDVCGIDAGVFGDTLRLEFHENVYDDQRGEAWAFFEALGFVFIGSLLADEARNGPDPDEDPESSAVVRKISITDIDLHGMVRFDEIIGNPAAFKDRVESR